MGNLLPCIFLSACLDTLDGIVARAVKGSSKFGAELDSLCDLVNFGVCPCVVMYLWLLHQLQPWWVGWLIATSFCACMACRLARFNTGADHSSSSASQTAYAKQQEQREKNKSTKDPSLKPKRVRPKVGSSYRHYFMGVPAPGGAIFALAPVLWYEKMKFRLSWILPIPIPYNWVIVYGAYIVIVSFLLVSTLPTYSSKMFGKDWIPVSWSGKLAVGIPSFIAFLGYLYLFGIDGWYAGLVLLVVYVGSFPFSYVTFRNMKAAEEKEKKKT